MDYPVTSYGKIYYHSDDERRYRVMNLSIQVNSWATSPHSPALEIDRQGHIVQHYTGNVQARATFYRRMRKCLNQTACYQGSELTPTGPTLCEPSDIRRLLTALPILESKTKERAKTKRRKKEYQLLLTAVKAGKCFIDNAYAINAQVNELRVPHAELGSGLLAAHQLRVRAQRVAGALGNLDFPDCQPAPQLLAEVQRRRARALEFTLLVQDDCLPLILWGILNELGICPTQKPQQSALCFVRSWAQSQITGWAWFHNNWSEQRLRALKQRLVELQNHYLVESEALLELGQVIDAAMREVEAFRDLSSPCNTFYYTALDELLREGKACSAQAQQRRLCETWEPLGHIERQRTEMRLCAWDGKHSALLHMELEQLLFFRLGEKRAPASGSPLTYLEHLSQDRANPEIHWRMQEFRKQLGILQQQLQAATGLVPAASVSKWAQPKLLRDCDEQISRYRSCWIAEDDRALKLLALPSLEEELPVFSFSCAEHTVQLSEEVLGRLRGPGRDYFHGLLGFSIKDYSFPVWKPGPSTLHMSPVLLAATAYYLRNGRIPAEVLRVYRSQLQALFAKLLLPAPAS